MPQIIGILDRHPGLRIGWFEGGINWVPSAIQDAQHIGASFRIDWPDLDGNKRRINIVRVLQRVLQGEAWTLRVAGDLVRVRRCAGRARRPG